MINNKPLQNKKIAVLTASGVSESDMTTLQRALMGAGGAMKLVSIDNAIINSWNGSGWGLNFMVDVQLNTALGVDYDVLIVPGGTRAFERLKRTAHTKRFMNSFVNLNRPIALISDAGELMDAIGADKDAANVIIVEDNEMQVMINHLTNEKEEVAQAA